LVYGRVVCVVDRSREGGGGGEEMWTLCVCGGVAVQHGALRSTYSVCVCVYKGDMDAVGRGGGHRGRRDEP